MNTDLPIYKVLVATQAILASVLKVGGNVDVITVPFARPGNTTAYTALDAVGPASAIITIAGVGRVKGGNGYIVGARLSTNKSGITPQCRIHIFNAIPTAIADNAPFAQLFADTPQKLGTIDLSAMATEGAGSDAAAAQNFQDRIPFQCADVDTSLYAVVETLDSFNPDSLQSFSLKISVDRN